MASVTYNIKGKYDGKAMNQAKSGLQSLAGEAKKAATAVVALVAAKALGGIKKVVDGSTQSFLNQNTALKSLTTAAQNAAIPLENLAKIRQDVSHGNFFDDDSLNNALKLATNMQLAEEQIREVMTAATDMAASGIMPLDTAVKTLSQSYSGNIGQLAKIAPELKNLTKEELANGAAVDVLKGKYAGFADQMSNTFGGRETQFKNAFADLQSEVGAIIQSFKFLSQGTFIQPIQNMTKLLNDNRENIIKFVLALPEMAKSAVNGIWQMIKDTFTGEGITNLFQFLGSTMINSFSNAIGFVKDIIIGFAETIKNLFDVTIGNIFALVNNSIMDVGNKLIETINTALSKVLDSKAVKWIAENIFKTKGFDGSNVISFRFSEKEYSSFQNFVDKEKNIVTGAVNSYKKAVSGFVKEEGKIFDKHKGMYENTAKTMKEKILEAFRNTTLPKDLQQAMTTGLAAVQNTTEEGADNSVSTSTTDKTGTGGTENVNNPFSGILSSLGQLGSTIQAFMQGGGGWVSILINFVGELVSKLQELSPAFSQVLNYMSTLVNEIAAPVADILESFLPDAVNVIKLIGRTVGKVIEMIAPVAKVILGGMLQTLLKTIAFVLTVIYNAVVAIHNLFSKKKNRWDYLSFAETMNSQSTSSSYAEVGIAYCLENDGDFFYCEDCDE